MNKQTNIHCSICGIDIPLVEMQQDNSRCPQCGNTFESAQQVFSRPTKTGQMSQRQLILMMVLLPLLVVAMTVGSWYLIKAYRLPSVDFDRNQSQSILVDSD